MTLIYIEYCIMSIFCKQENNKIPFVTQITKKYLAARGKYKKLEEELERLKGMSIENENECMEKLLSGVRVFEKS